VSVPEHSKTLDPSSIPAPEQARLLSLAEVVPLLASPDTRRPLSLDADGGSLHAGDERFPVRSGLPLLFPARVQPFLGARELEVPLAHGRDALLQYVFLSLVKQRGGEANTPHDDVNYLKHIHRARVLVREARGVVLDVGCDSPRISKAIFPAGTSYVGLDSTYADAAQFRLIGMAEFLPIRDAAVENVALLTSLDHVLDHHRALDEAWRVLAPGGMLYLATLVWSERAELFHDHVHFHHFREHEILGALARFSIETLQRYPWKGDTHRSGWYLRARKVDGRA